MYLEAITKPSWTIGVELAWGRTPAEVPCVNGKKRQVAIDTRNKLRETTWSRSRALSRLRKGAGPDGHDRGRASQFDPTIDKERK